jgi:thiosulfate/3-mercaptopyruvate sulfurtransferase
MAAARRQDGGAGVSTAPTTVAPLVSAEWLMDHIDDHALVLLDARITREFVPGSPKRYVAAPDRYEVDGHLPGARFVDLISDLSDPASGLNFTLPQVPALEVGFRALGVNDDSTVVAYDDDSGVWAARIWWLLRSIGHQGAAVLNGGLRAWVAAGGELAHSRPQAGEPGGIVADPQPGYFTSHQQVKTLTDSRQASTLMCALEPAVFSGERSSGAAREGRIPGSVSFPYSALLDKDGLIDPARVDPALAGAGIDVHAPLVTYCGGGITACGVALALAAAGHPGVSVYDGSLQEWAADETTQMAVGGA